MYMCDYIKLPPASFHHDLISALSDHNDKMLEVIGFRGSAKTSFTSTMLPLWAALQHPERYPFIVLISDTATQAAANIAAIKHELENNSLLKNDFAKRQIWNKEFSEFEATLESNEEWQSKNMLLDNGVRIFARSRGQKIRGLRHLSNRPTLIIVDDPEDGEWVKTKENRNKTDRWLKSEVIPALSADGRLVVIGNLLHDDALMSRLKKSGLFHVLEFPLITKKGEVTWTARYPTLQSLLTQRQLMGEVAWQREMLLNPVSEEGAEVRPSDIQYYDTVPRVPQGLRGHGIDLAISTKASADYTAKVHGDIYYEDSRPFVYIQKYPLNVHFTFHQMLEYMKTVPESGGQHIMFVEDVAFQKAAIQEMERASLPVVPLRPIADKRARLRVAAIYIKNGTVKFPRTGCEELIAQLLNFGTEAYDDLVDALVYLILGLVAQGLDMQKVVWMNGAV